MMKYFYITGFIVCILFFTACANKDSSQSGSLPKGVTYTIFHHAGHEENITPAHIIKIYQRIYIGDKLVQDGTKGFPGYQHILREEDSRKGHNYLNLVLLKAKKGDSIIFTQSLDSIRTYSYLPTTEAGYIRMQILILDVFHKEEDANADKAIEVASFKEREKKAIVEYTQAKGIEVEETAEGIFIQRTSSPTVTEQRTIACPDGTDTCSVVVRYEGKTIPDEKMFDENYTKQRPLTVKLGSNQVIAGFEYAIMHMSIGETVAVYIPSMLAYKELGDKMGLIAPFQPVMFKITLEGLAK